MCFSAGASFTAAAVLSIIGCLTVKKAKSSNQLFLACMPLIFAFQQLVEGCLWLTVPQQAAYEQFSDVEKYIYLTLALAVWPIWVPLSMFALETERWRKWILMAFLLVGLVYGGMMIANLARIWPSRDVTVAIVHKSIQYTMPVQYGTFYIALYGILTLLVPFFSSFKWMWQLAVVNFAAAVFTHYFFSLTFISVWCFFAAIISLSLYAVLSYQPEQSRVS